MIPTRRITARRENGAAPVESLFAILFVLLLALGVIQVALFLYARNVVLGAAHEGARAAVERGRDGRDAQEIATMTVRRATGHLVRDLEVGAAIVDAPVPLVRVQIRALVRPIGPVPVSLPVRAEASARRDVVVP